MDDASFRVLAVAGSLHARSATRVVVTDLAARLRSAGAQIDLLDLAREPLPLFNPDTAFNAPGYPALQARVEGADVLILGTPDYHGSISSALKNFLDHFWTEFAGKLVMPVVASHEKGLTVMDQLRTVARQCYAWVLPYGISFVDKEDVKDGRVASESLAKRVAMAARDLHVYGKLLAAQRRSDLDGADQGFLARYRDQ